MINRYLQSRFLAGLAAATLVMPALVGCGSGGGTDTRTSANLPPIDDTRGGRSQDFGAPVQRQPAQEKKGMSTGTKVAVLAGAAALYYMYNKNKQKRAQGDKSAPQYYLSKNGRVYYRDADGRAHWVTPPQGGIQVPMQEATQYQDYQGYNNRTSGRTLEQLYKGGGF